MIQNCHQHTVHLDLRQLASHSADPEARWASWQRAWQAGSLSPNEVRAEEAWPASTDPTANSIEPPAMGGAQPGQGDEPKPPAPAPSDDEGDKIARLDQRRAR